MGDQNEALTAFPAQLEEQVHDLAAGFMIEVPRGFVGEDQARFAYHGAGQGDPLAFSTRHLRRKVGDAVGQSDLLEGLAGKFLEVSHSLEFQGNPRVFQGRQVAHEVVLLKNNAQVLGTKFT